jgi:hypothetical protein
MNLLVVTFIATIVWALWAADRRCPKARGGASTSAKAKVILVPVLADAWVLPTHGLLEAARLRHLREVLESRSTTGPGEGPALVRRGAGPDRPW